MRNAAGIAFVGPGFVRTLGLTLLTGRDILDVDRPASQRVAVVNESFATNFFGRSEVVGRTFSVRTRPTSTRHSPSSASSAMRATPGCIARPGSMMYVAQAQSDARSAGLRRQDCAGPSALATSVRQTLAALDPNVGILRMATAEAQIDDMLRRERLLAALGTAFAGLALLLVAIGLYGMLNGVVVRRTSEIGVRMALGADRSRIGWMLAREAGAILAIGIAAGRGWPHRDRKGRSVRTAWRHAQRSHADCGCRWFAGPGCGGGRRRARLACDAHPARRRLASGLCVGSPRTRRP